MQRAGAVVPPSSVLGWLQARGFIWTLRLTPANCPPPCSSTVCRSAKPRQGRITAAAAAAAAAAAGPGCQLGVDSRVTWSLRWRSQARQGGSQPWAQAKSATRAEPHKLQAGITAACPWCAHQL